MRSLSILALLAASCTLASAATVSSLCTVASQGGTTLGTYNGGTGSLTYDCSGFSAPSGFEITSISVLGRVDYQFGIPGTNTFQVSFDLPAGFSPDPNVVANTGGESSSGIANGTSTYSPVPLASFAAFSVAATGSTTQGAVDAGSATIRVTYTYEAQQQNGDVPEPSTLALVGGVLVLAGIRKFRR